MTLEDFSNEFDTLIQSYNNNQPFGITDRLSFNEYDKSVFLTKAQEEIVIELYNGKNSFRDSFEKTEEIRSYLRGLIKTYITSEKQEGRLGLTKNSVFFKLPEDLLFITYESVDLEENPKCSSGENFIVFPTTQDEFHRIKRNPFRGANNRRVLRIDAGENIVEIISKYDIYSYTVRYLAKPEPIILIDLPPELFINTKGIKSECKLNPIIHRIILERAVRLALISKSVITEKE